MIRLRALQIVLACVGAVFLALGYPMVTMLRQEPALVMMLSLYVTLGVFLLLAVRAPGMHRSLISFTAWSSLAHALVMGVQVARGVVAHSEWIGVAVLAVIALALLALHPAKLPAN